MIEYRLVRRRITTLKFREWVAPSTQHITVLQYRTITEDKDTVRATEWQDVPVVEEVEE